MKIRWSAFELAAIYAMAEREKNAKAVAHALNRSIDSVYYKTRREGLRIRLHPQWSKNEVDTLRDCKTIEEAAYRLARTPTAVFNKAKRLGVKLDCREYFKKRNHA